MIARVDRVRAEPFGAWVRIDAAESLVAIDRALAQSVGIDGGAAWSDGADAAPTRPLEVHLAVTARCPSGCEGCYLDARPDGLEPERATLEARLDVIAAAGAFTVAFGGGEPMSRADIGELAAYARRVGLVPVMTTSGLGLGAERARELGAFAQVNVSHDGVDGAYGAVRGYDGGRAAERALEHLLAAGVPAGVNYVLTRASFDALGATAARVASLGARELQLLRYKPAGRAASLDYLDRRLSPAQVDALFDAIGAIVRGGALRVRIDCALLPLLSSRIVDDATAARLATYGVLGCEAARHLAAAKVDGRLAPCSFTDATSADVAALEPAWAREPELERFRAWHAALPQPCASCPLVETCRGGCQVVSRHLGAGAFAPDPECPRVRAAGG